MNNLDILSDEEFDNFYLTDIDIKIKKRIDVVTDILS